MNVTSSNSVSTQASAAPAKTATDNALGKDAFLKILVTQMKNQNPLEPLKDTEFIGQMAQFSSLEQLTNLNTSMNQFIGTQSNTSLTDHADLIGNTVYWEQTVDGKLESGEGTVKALSLKNGELQVELENDVKVPLGSINRIEKQ
ncbi:flagellar hook assembly protein FlgD [Planomicrobium sp. CPCC 101079]|uniref:flagellar hook assembly protein FlgD n=1 Tax=Planomicrobium sp. CPCC 101079 TaxID=2599618 RepID=UPI0011B744DE|nr:flagellar hook assembly protein FlgD [Planomicrobium sp. CPCC 101079]TWT03697.1 flagellar hook assembly protein FlgD [Planomicrobium sp. CPCC 101079]